MVPGSGGAARLAAPGRRPVPSGSPRGGAPEIRKKRVPGAPKILEVQDEESPEVPESVGEKSRVDDLVALLDVQPYPEDGCLSRNASGTRLRVNESHVCGHEQRGVPASRETARTSPWAPQELCPIQRKSRET